MRKLSMYLCVLLFTIFTHVLCVNSNPLPIHVLTSSFTISGTVWGTYFNGDDYSDSYNQTGSTFLEDSTYWVDPDMGYMSDAQSSVDNFKTDASSQSFYGGFGEASATATWTFSPLVDNYSDPIMFRYSYYWGDITGKLTDQNTGNILWDFRGDYFGMEDYFTEINTTFSSNHVYELYLSSWGGASKGMDNPSYGEISTVDFIAVKPIPEPTTMLLFGTGLIGLIGASFRRKKK